MARNVRAGLVLMTGALAAFGVASANGLVLAAAAFPLMLLAASFVLRPRVESARLVVAPNRAVLGEPMQVYVEATARGHGPLGLHVALPESFRLLEGQNAVHAWVDGDTPLVWQFQAAGDRRGAHLVGPLMAEATHPALLGPPTVTRLADPVEVRVDLRQARLGNAAVRTRAKLRTGEEDRVRTGTATSDFRDIRRYQRGDPMKAINWKATARRGEVGHTMQLLVNEYEHEARKQAWIFLDARSAGDLGTNLHNGFEARVAAATALAQHHLERGHPVGFTVFHHRAEGLPYADQSGRQRLRLRQALEELVPEPLPGRPLPEAVDAVRGQLRSANTQAFVVTTSLGAPDDVSDGLRRLRNTLARGRGPPPLTVLDVDPAGYYPDPAGDHIAPTLRLLGEAPLESWRRLGVPVLRWDAGRFPIQSVLEGLRA
ncbi:MAG: hypothetical protein QOD77_2111 [Thermoplasmata archaeon]|jgi:uncharacterized protein (DUF58 family)|nr:hypothetical protein [Thermoplasmata archaeon]